MICAKDFSVPDKDTDPRAFENMRGDRSFLFTLSEWRESAKGCEENAQCRVSY